MDKLAILLKTYAGDFDYTKRLVNSYKKYNADKIPLYITSPVEDLDKFKCFKSRLIKVLSDESITKDLVRDNSILGIRPGYINQEIIKLSFWKTGICSNYFCLDSDAVFIRNFYFSDFMFDSDTPYTILSEDNELKVDPGYYKDHWKSREKLIRRIQEEIDLIDNRVLTCHSFAIFSSKVLKSFDEKFLKPRNLTYKDILKISPYEFSWYNIWLQKDKTIEIKFKEPVIKFFHQKSQHLDYLKKGITIDDIARGYIGYNINSNYSRGFGVVSYNEAYKYWPPVSFKSIWWRILKRINV